MFRHDVESGLKELEPKLAVRLRRIRKYLPMTGLGLRNYRVNILGITRLELIEAVPPPMYRPEDIRALVAIRSTGGTRGISASGFQDDW